jgi:hypothetical protein
VSTAHGRLSLPLGLLAAAVVVLIALRAPAQVPSRSTVVLVRSDPPDPNLGEAYLRMHGELRAAGFDVSPEASLQNLEPTQAQALALTVQALRPAAVIGIFENPNGGLEFWILDARSGRTAVGRIARGGESERAPEILAISAVELLLASLSELDIKPAREPAEAPTALPPGSASASTSFKPPQLSAEQAGTSKDRAHRLHFGFELGVGASIATGGGGVAWLPALRLQWAPLPALRVRLSGLGLGTHPEISGPGGSARTTQGIALADAVLRPWDLPHVCPQLSLGAGAYYFQVEGRSAQGSAEATASKWSAALDFGAELAWKQHRRLEVLFGAHALFAEPYPSIRFFDVQKATAGRPTIVFSATAAGWL